MLQADDYQKQSGKAIPESEEWFRNIVENQSEYITRHLPGGVMTYVNTSLAKSIGVDADTLIGTSFYPFIHEQDREETIIKINSVTPANPSVTIECRIEPGNDCQRWLHWEHTGIFDTQGTLIEYQGVGRDITERKLSESALRESENKHRLLFECAGDSISVISMQGRFLAVNPLSCKLIGYSHEEFLDLSLDKLETRPDMLPEMFDLVLKRGHNTFDAQHFRKDGSIIDISVDSRLITWDGEPAIMNIARDITERKQTERQLQDAFQFNSQIISSVMEGVIVYDLDLRFRVWNPFMEKLTGKSAGEVLGGHPSELFPFTTKVGLVERLKSLTEISGSEAASLIPETIEFQYSIPETEKYGWVSQVCAPLLNSLGDVIGVIATVRDITEAKRAEEERLMLERQFLHAQKLESLGIMAGGIAHDFNNLLQAILGNIELASTKLVPNSAPHEFITSAMKSANHAAHLTNLMLAYTGKGYQERTALNLNTLVMENADMLRTTAGAAIPIQLTLSAELPAILANQAQLQQVVMNLITNAAESIEKLPGSISLTTGTQQCDHIRLAASLLIEKPEPGLFVFLEVADNGCGMNEETIARLFDPFFTTKFTGRGLGMSAVMGIIKAHRGALLVESTVGAGTTFRALFPVSDEVPPVLVVERTVAPSKESLSAKKLLSGIALVVDDEKTVLKVAVRMASLCGLTVITAINGIDAVTKFRDHADEIVVVLMDLTMPDMDGITAMNEIYSIRPTCKVILASGFNEYELSSRITGQEPAGFIRKPYNMKALETELQRVLQTD
ncbi:MAG: PAS domain S-box protein [Desulfuromonadales bacterium]